MKEYIVNLKNPEDTPEKIAQKLNSLTSAVSVDVINGAVSKKEFDEFQGRVKKYTESNKERLDINKNDLRWHGGGLSAVAHDASLSGAGTPASPLSVAGGGSGTVTSVSVTTANGFSGTVASGSTTPAITIIAGAITPASVAAVGAVTGSNLSGTNTGDQTNISGNAATVTTNANLTGPITSIGNATSLASTTGTGTTIVVQTNPTITKPVINARNQTAQTYTPAGAATATLDLSLSDQHYITMPAGNITIALSNDTANQIFLASITQDSVGSRTVTWFTTIKWAGGVAPTLTPTANKRDVFGFIRTGSGTYDGFVIGQNI